MRRLTLLIVGAFLGIVLLFSAVPTCAAATNIFEKTCDGQTDSATCSSLNPPNGTNPLTGSDGILLRVASIIAIVAGFTALLLIIVGGFNYITAGGDAQKAKKARDMIIGALIGVVIIALSSIIITFVIRNSGV